MSTNTIEAPKRVNEVLENYKAYKENKDAFMNGFRNKELAKVNERKEFMNKYNKIRENRLLSEQEHCKLVEDARSYYFKNALKGIYIGALEAGTLTDDALFLAENMVDSYVDENHGYSGLIQKVDADTYLLAKIRRLVEDAAEQDVENIENQKEDIDNIEDIDIEDSPEDEKDSMEVPEDTTITTANIEDIVQALNQAGMEVVKKDNADNFKEELPETPENTPETPAEDNAETGEETPAEEPVSDETPAEVPADDAEATGETPENTEEVPAEDNAPETPADNMDMNAPENGGKEAPAPEGEVKEDPTNITAAEDEPKEDEAPAETEDKADEDIEDAEEEEDELTKDIKAADEKEKEESEEDDDFEDTMDPDSVAIQDDDESDSDDLDDFDDEDFGEDDDDEDEDSDEEDEGEDIDIDADGEPDIGDVDEPEPTVNVDPNKTMMDELENEKEIKDAIELIRSRVADAEEAFIKRNQEDKEQIDALLSKISQNVATVEKISNDDSTEAESAKKTMEESTLMYKQKINSIVSDKPMTIFDKMTRNISESIIKDPNKVKMFVNESTGTPDMTYIVEASKVMYAFLETLNTLQLEKVDGAYITKMINSMS